MKYLTNYRYLQIALLLLAMYPINLLAENSFEPGSSLANQNQNDWSERDNKRNPQDLSNQSGSSFERQNPAKAPYPPRAYGAPEIIFRSELSPRGQLRRRMEYLTENSEESN